MLTRILAACLLFCAVIVPQARSAQDDIVRVACLGDSITAGNNVADEDRYPAQLQALLGDRYEVRNLGLGSATLLRAGSPNVWQKLDAALQFEPHIVTIALGTNDTVSGRRANWEKIANFETDYAELIDRLAELPTRPRILLCTPTDMVLDTPDLSEARVADLTLRRPRLLELCQRIRILAADHTPQGVELVELNHLFTGKPELIKPGDGVHPNPAGYAEIARALAAAIQPRPNIILCMTDDQGAADAGFRGHPAFKSPNLDALASRGMVLTNFYAQSPVCSPTRASCLTGMHPDRLGITGANAGHMPEPVTTLAELLRDQGYATGHFGKWHLGTLTTTLRDSNRGGRPDQAAHYAPPWDHGFDVCFSTEAKVPTADPMTHPDTGEPYGTRYWTGPDRIARDNLEGDDSRIIMDRVVPFIERCAEQDQPFLAVVWFHAPHLPLVALPENQAPYADRPDAAYLSALTGVDQQMGRLWQTLQATGAADNTLLLFCSDNGPERQPGESVHADPTAYAHHPYGSASPYRGRKRSLHDGGLRTPAFAVWPKRIPAGSLGSGLACTTDYLPTIADALEIPPPDTTLDGVSLLPMLIGRDWSRPAPLRFVSNNQRSIIDWPYKLIARDANGPFSLFDLSRDEAETTNLAQDHPDLTNALTADLTAWLQSVREDRARFTQESP